MKQTKIWPAAWTSPEQIRKIFLSGAKIYQKKWVSKYKGVQSGSSLAPITSTQMYTHTHTHTQTHTWQNVSSENIFKTFKPLLSLMLPIYPAEMCSNQILPALLRVKGNWTIHWCSQSSLYWLINTAAQLSKALLWAESFWNQKKDTT